MYKFCAVIFFSVLLSLKGNSQVLQVDTLRYSGNPDKYLNFVVMGDGYTAAQQNTFIADANNTMSLFLNESPWKEYRDYVNVFAIRVISAESGVKHPRTATDCSSDPPLLAISNPKNYLGSTFDFFGIHRLVVADSTANIASVLADNFPNYDLALIVANSSRYGGSGGAFSIATVHPLSNQVMIHEAAHTFADLADEYYPGDAFAFEKPNMTQDTSVTTNKWRNWLNTSGVGIYQHCCGGNSSQWYKPNNNCKMETLSAAFCPVCSEAIVESIHELVDPVVAYVPENLLVDTTENVLSFKLTELMKPVPNTLKIDWAFNGSAYAENVDSVAIDQSTLPNGTYTLTATVVDTTLMVRTNNHPSLHFSTVEWTIQKFITGLEATSSTSRLELQLYPNPSTEDITVTLDGFETTPVMQIVDVNGRIVIKSDQFKTLGGSNSFQVNVNTLPSGSYWLHAIYNSKVYSLGFVKQ